MLKKLRFLVLAATLLIATTAWGEPYIAHNDGTLTDPLSGVEWSDDASTPTVGICNGGQQSWEQAQIYIACLNDNDYLGNNDWRLPTAHEFGTLIGSLDKATGLQGKAYWTGSEFGRDGKDAYSFNLATGATAKVTKTRQLAVWPVRDAASIIEVSQSTEQSSFTANAVVVPKYSVTVVVGPNGRVSPQSLTNVKSGTKKTFTVTPLKGFVTKSIIVDNVPQTLTGKDLTKPIKVLLTVNKDITINATFDDAPKVSGFPTNLTPGDYQLDISYCIKVPQYNQCSEVSSTTVTFDANNASLFFDYFNTYFDLYFNQYNNVGCKAKSACTKFNGVSFDCKLTLTCKVGPYSAGYVIDYLFTKK